MRTKLKKEESSPWQLETTAPDDRKLPKPIGNVLITPRYEPDKHEVWRYQETVERGGLFHDLTPPQKRVLKKKKR
jgi:hypothetical protein